MKDFISKLWQFFRSCFYRLLSDVKKIDGNVRRKQPLLLKGPGTVIFGKRCEIGVRLSPGFFSSYGYIEVRRPEAFVRLGDRVIINNGCTLISDGAGITIGDNVLVGNNVYIADSDFHGLEPALRREAPPAKAVTIGNNVFIGYNATILKGVSIGENSVVAACSVVTRDVPANCVVAGNPAREIRQLP
ncbi:MAG TPA: DapH/DapD/GlmU-related protein [Pseudomonadales bacterium]|nr:DapH/DapD/GlmU-related protein [Pseudomonadales bacterium]